jgi:hypothetical protein
MMPLLAPLAEPKLIEKDKWNKRNQTFINYYEIKSGYENNIHKLSQKVFSVPFSAQKVSGNHNTKTR